MSKQEFKNTIGYKAYKTQIKTLTIIMSVVVSIQWIMGLILFFYFYSNSYKSVAFIVLISLIITPLVESIIPVIGLCSHMTDFPQSTII